MPREEGDRRPARYPQALPGAIIGGGSGLISSPSNWGFAVAATGLNQRNRSRASESLARTRGPVLLRVIRRLPNTDSAACCDGRRLISQGRKPRAGKGTAVRRARAMGIREPLVVRCRLGVVLSGQGSQREIAVAALARAIVEVRAGLPSARDGARRWSLAEHRRGRPIASGQSEQPSSVVTGRLRS